MVKTKSVSWGLGLKTVAIDIWGFSGVGVSRFIADHGHSKRKTTALGFFNPYLMLVMGSGL